MKKERDYIVQALKESGIKGKIHESMKSLRNCNEVHVGAVLRIGESFTRSGSKKRYGDKEGHLKQRNKLFERITKLRIVIGDSNEQKVETILTDFLKCIGKGFVVDNNWIDIKIEEADWVESDDSILKSNIAVEFDVTLTGGIYIDTDVVEAKVENIGV